MSHSEQDGPPHGLTEERISMAMTDLDEAEAVDLATASNAALVALVEKLRGSLSDVIRLARQLSH